MSVDCHITLPDNVRVDNVADVIGIAAGLKPVWEYSDNGKHKWVKVRGVEARSSGVVPGMALISIRSTGHLLVDGEDQHSGYYHFEACHDGRLLSVTSTAFWIAVGHRLVDFFGGSIDYQDCDDVEVNYCQPAKLRRENSPEDGEDWDNFQERLFNLKPITEEELRNYHGKGAYDNCR